MQKVNLDEALAKIVAKDQRYHLDAYRFVQEAIDHTQKNLGRNAKGAGHHVTGQQLLDGIRDYALQAFGPMAITVLEEWGVRTCEDFGEIVFNMVGESLLAVTENDRREDFKGRYTFLEAFRHPFLPAAKRPRPAAQTNIV